MTIEHNTQAPSDWVRRWGHLIPDRPGGARVLDLACGHGRHSRWLMRQGHQVTAVDRDAEALAGLADLAPWVRTLSADLENAPWPLAGREFEAVVVTNYLWRPLLPQVLASLAPGGLLDGNSDDLAMFLDIDGGRFAGGADHTDAVRAFGDMPVDQLAQRSVIDAAVFVHGSDQGDDAAGDGFHGGVSRDIEVDPHSTQRRAGHNARERWLCHQA